MKFTQNYLWKLPADFTLFCFTSRFCHIDLLILKRMSEIKDLKKEHKKLEAITRKTTKKRLNDRTSDSWMNLRKLKKLKLRVKDKINQFKR